MSVIIREKEARRRLGDIGKTKFDQDFLKTGRLTRIYLGPRSVGYDESAVDRVVNEVIADSIANPHRRAFSPNDFKRKS